MPPLLPQTHLGLHKQGVNCDCLHFWANSTKDIHQQKKKSPSPSSFNGKAAQTLSWPPAPQKQRNFTCCSSLPSTTPGAGSIQTLAGSMQAIYTVSLDIR